ncbi:MAG: AI-2E family transporter, partial [Spirochaetia bacterium]|nr:AI-2E family transporter [Spirochaetia bacterium]
MAKPPESSPSPNPSRDPVRLLARLAILVATLALLYFLGRTLAGVLFPVGASLILAYLFDPFVGYLEKRGIRRTFGILLILFAGGVLFFVFAMFFYPIVHTQILRLIEHLPSLSAMLQEKFLPWAKSQLGATLPTDMADAVEKYGTGLKDALPSIFNKLGKGLIGAVSTTSAVVSSLMNLVLIPVFTFYFLRDFNHLKPALVPFIPARFRNYAVSRAKAVDAVVGHWFRGQLTVAFILALLYGAGFGMVFYSPGLELRTGIVVGVLTGFLSLIPYLGAITGSILCVLFALLDWHGIFPFVGIAAVFALVQVLEGYVLTPRIVGERLGLSPVVVIIALLVGGALAGL